MKCRALKVKYVDNTEEVFPLHASDRTDDIILYPNSFLNTDASQVVRFRLLDGSHITLFIREVRLIKRIFVDVEIKQKNPLTQDNHYDNPLN